MNSILTVCKTVVAAAALVITVWIETSAAGKEELVLKTNGRLGPLGLEHSWGHLGHCFLVVYTNSISQHLKWGANCSRVSQPWWFKPEGVELWAGAAHLHQWYIGNPWVGAWSEVGKCGWLYSAGRDCINQFYSCPGCAGCLVWRAERGSLGLTAGIWGHGGYRAEGVDAVSKTGIIFERRKRRRNLILRRANTKKELKDRFRKANGARLLLSEHRLVPKWLGKLRSRQEVIGVWKCKM